MGMIHLLQVQHLELFLLVVPNNDGLHIVYINYISHRIHGTGITYIYHKNQPFM